MRTFEIKLNEVPYSIEDGVISLELSMDYGFQVVDGIEVNDEMRPDGMMNLIITAEADSIVIDPDKHHLILDNEGIYLDYEMLDLAVEEGNLPAGLSYSQPLEDEKLEKTELFQSIQALREQAYARES